MACILSANEITLPDEFNQDQLNLDVGLTSVADVILHGRITECNTDIPIVGAIVKLIDEQGNWICHTFSGCNGLYMLRIPPEFASQTITVAVTCTNCSELGPCECPEVP